jgi:hypothetical protein
MPTEIAHACAFRNNISHENFVKGRFSRLISGSASPPRPGLLAKGNPNVVGTPSIVGTPVCVLGHVGVLGAVDTDGVEGIWCGDWFAAANPVSVTCRWSSRRSSKSSSISRLRKLSVVKFRRLSFTRADQVIEWRC